MNFSWPIGMLPPAIPGVTTPVGNTPQVNTQHPSYMKMLQRWRVVDDCCQGEEIIKFKGELYLPRPNPEDRSADNLERYRCYKQRAVFYNVTKRTLRGLTGEVFVIDPVAYVPDQMKNMLNDVNGAGLTIIQQAKEALDDTLKFGRLGLYVDFPKTQGGVSREDILSGAYKPMIFKISPIDIINWRTKLVGSRVLKSLVVFQERYITDDDTFARSEADQYRVLRLGHMLGGVVTDYNVDEASVYINEVWRPDGNGGFKQVGPSIAPLDADGNPFKEIPFYLIGSDNNEIEPCEPPLYDIAILNIAHYRNSADYEESAYICGQPMLWYSGITNQWQDSVFKGQRVQFGSRSGLPLPVHGTAGILQAKENTLPMEAMKHKEAQMVAIGAKLVEIGGTVKTATQDYQEKVEESNVLASCAKNVSEGYSQALRFASRFIDTQLNQSEISYKLNTDFSTSRMTAQERLQLMKEWQGGVMAWDEVRFRLHRAGIALMDDEKAKAAIEAEKPQRQVAFQTIVADTRMDRGGSTGGGQ